MLYHGERKRCKCSFQRFFDKIFSSINLTDLLTDSHIGQSLDRENGKTGPRTLLLVGNFPIMPWTSAFTWPNVQIPEDPCLERLRDTSAVLSDFFTRFFRRLI